MADLPADGSLEIRLNGEPHRMPVGSTVADLVRGLGLDGRPVAVERNRSVIARSLHAETRLEPGDDVEVVTLVGGG